MTRSQENCLFDNHRFNLRAIGRGLLSVYISFPAIIIAGIFYSIDHVIFNGAPLAEGIAL